MRPPRCATAWAPAEFWGTMATTTHFWNDVGLGCEHSLDMVCFWQVRQNQEAAAAFADRASELLLAGDLASIKRSVRMQSAWEDLHALCGRPRLSKKAQESGCGSDVWSAHTTPSPLS